MTDVGKALEAATKATLAHRISGVYPTTSEQAAQAAILAFLRAMPEQDPDLPPGHCFNLPWRMVEAIEKETAP